MTLLTSFSLLTTCRFGRIGGLVLVSCTGFCGRVGGCCFQLIGSGCLMGWRRLSRVRGFGRFKRRFGNRLLAELIRLSFSRRSAAKRLLSARWWVTAARSWVAAARAGAGSARRRAGSARFGVEHPAWLLPLWSPRRLCLFSGQPQRTGKRAGPAALPADKLICGATPHKIAPTTAWGAPLSGRGAPPLRLGRAFAFGRGAPPLGLGRAFACVGARLVVGLGAPCLLRPSTVDTRVGVPSTRVETLVRRQGVHVRPGVRKGSAVLPAGHRQASVSAGCACRTRPPPPP